MEGLIASCCRRLVACVVQVFLDAFRLLGEFGVTAQRIEFHVGDTTRWKDLPNFLMDS